METQDIQSLVFSGHARLRRTLAVGFAIEDRRLARAAMARLVEAHVAFGVPARERKSAVQLVLSAAGIREMDGDDRAMEPLGFAFRQGMISPQRSRALGDLGRNDPGLWHWSDRTAHLVLLIYHNDGDQGAARPAALLGASGSGLRQTFSLSCILPDDAREPFGFRDGITSLRMDTGLESGAMAGDLVAPGELVLGRRNAQGITLPAPPLGVDGSFVVLRQLEQDVQGFWEFWRAQAASEEEAVWLAAKAVGRWPNGMPFRTDASRTQPAWMEDEMKRAWSFSKDPAGRDCPLGAHIRRANPRETLFEDQTASLTAASHHRLLRRGRMYGKAAPSAWYPALVEQPQLGGGMGNETEGRGLLFAALCADLNRQFEFVQQSWLNNPKFMGLRDEVDPIAAGDDIPGNGRHFSIPQCPVRHRVSGVRGWVTVKGGGYFLLPGRNALLGWLAGKA